VTFAGSMSLEYLHQNDNHVTNFRQRQILISPPSFSNWRKDIYGTAHFTMGVRLSSQAITKPLHCRAAVKCTAKATSVSATVTSRQENTSLEYKGEKR
jgi:hypothetical protein